MCISIVGPLSSGLAVGTAGNATSNQTSTGIVRGKILAVHVTYHDSPPAGTTDVTVATAGAGNAFAATILSLANAATDGTWYPVAAASDTSGAAFTYDGTNEVAVRIPVHDKIKVTIAQANANDYVQVWLLVE